MVTEQTYRPGCFENMKYINVSLLLLMIAMLIVGCTDASWKAVPYTSTHLPNQECVDEDSQNWHLFMYDIESGKYERMTDGEQVIDLFPTFSPDGRRLAFIRNRNTINVLDMTTGEIDFLLEYPGDLSDLTWSPDGKRLAFISNKDGVQQIYTVDSTGTNVSCLTDGDFSKSSLTWLPDSRQIAFLGPSSLISGTNAIYVVAVDSVLDTPKEVITSFCPSQQRSECKTFHSVAWAPNSDTVAISMGAYNWSFVATPKEYPVMLYEQEGNGVIIFAHDSLTTIDWTALGEFKSLSWASDESHLVYYKNCGCGSEQIGIIEIVTRKDEVLFDIEHVGHIVANPIWVPNRKAVVYSQASCIQK